jgi:hypothetical protein
MSKRIWWIVITGLAIACLAEVFFPDHHHAIFPWHRIPCFDAAYGFVGCIAIVFVSKAIGKFFLWKTTYSVPLLERHLGDKDERVVIREWHVDVGQKVGKDQSLVEVESEQGLTMVHSPTTGRVARLFADPGETIDVGETLADVRITKAELKRLERGEDTHV